jgi:Flp pilus assembly protein TadG
MRIKFVSQKGAALVEFALVLPILLVLVFGIIEFGVMLFDKAVITNASREGARAGIVYSYPNKITEGEISAIVSQYCGTNLVSLGQGSAPVVKITGVCSKAGDSLTVGITYPYHFLVLPSFIVSLTGPTNLVAESVMRCE